MVTHILLTVAVILIAGLAFGLTSHKLGRGDKRPGCGRGECSACNPENRNAECPSAQPADNTGGNENNEQ